MSWFVFWFLPHPARLWIARRFGTKVKIGDGFGYLLGESIYFDLKGSENG